MTPNLKLWLTTMVLLDSDVQSKIAGLYNIDTFN